MLISSHEIFSGFAIAAGILTAIGLLTILFAWVRYRIPSGPVIEHRSRVRFQMIDIGQFERSSLRYWLIEMLLRNRRLFLEDGPFSFVYAPGKQIDLCWQESPFGLQDKGCTVEVTYRTRRLRFSDGCTPATLLSIQRVPGVPKITK